MRNSSLVKWFCAENLTGLSLLPKLRLTGSWTLEVGYRREKIVLRSYQDLEVYKRSYQLLLDIHKLSFTLPDRERFELSSQLRKAAVSVPLNIAQKAADERIV